MNFWPHQPTESTQTSRLKIYNREPVDLITLALYHPIRALLASQPWLSASKLLFSSDSVTIEA